MAERAMRGVDALPRRYGRLKRTSPDLKLRQAKRREALAKKDQEYWEERSARAVKGRMHVEFELQTLKDRLDRHSTLLPPDEIEWGGDVSSAPAEFRILKELHMDAYYDNREFGHHLVLRFKDRVVKYMISEGALNSYRSNPPESIVEFIVPEMFRRLCAARKSS